MHCLRRRARLRHLQPLRARDRDHVRGGAAEEDGVVTGYAYASAWKTRSAYRFSVESTVYVAADHCGRGIGTRLYRALIAALREQNVHYVTGGIALPNPASVALHERLGFRKNGHFSEVGFKFGRWVDVGYWELIL